MAEWEQQQLLERQRRIWRLAKLRQRQERDAERRQQLSLQMQLKRCKMQVTPWFYDSGDGLMTRLVYRDGFAADGPEMSKQLYALAGEAVTCTNGHRIALFARDVYCHEVIDGEMFVDKHDGVDWSPGAPLGNCPECDAPWNGSDNPSGHDGILHLSDGWRRRDIQLMMRH